MTEFKPEHLAKEAARLRDDPILGHAVAELRRDALEALSLAHPDDRNAIIHSQALVRLCDQFLLKLEAYILALGSDHPGGPVV